MIIVVSTSLNPQSKSRRLAELAVQLIRERQQDAYLLDLQTLSLPLCDGSAAHTHPHVLQAQELIQKASAIIITAPIYNYSVASSCKNFIELTGSSWKDKVVAVMAAAGSVVSYMAVAPFITSLFLDFHCHLVPRLVVATSAAFNEAGQLINTEIKERVVDLTEQTIALQHALAHSLYALKEG